MKSRTKRNCENSCEVGIEDWKIEEFLGVNDIQFDFGATIVSILINCRDNFTSSYYILSIVGDK